LGLDSHLENKIRNGGKILSPIPSMFLDENDRAGVEQDIAGQIQLFTVQCLDSFEYIMM
jgi:hypothetical protein